MANGCATYAQNEEEFLDEVTKTLAGRAGVSLIYGVMDIQASADIEQADKLMDIWLCHFAGGGFVGIESGDNRMSSRDFLIMKPSSQQNWKNFTEEHIRFFVIISIFCLLCSMVFWNMKRF